MPFFLDKLLEAIGKEDLEQLLGVPESEQLEFKEGLPGKDELDAWHRGADSIGEYAKRELLSEIVAFANSYGGLLVVGVGETSSKPPRADRVTPVPRCGELAGRLTDVVRDQIEPPIPQLLVRAVPTEDDGSGAILVRVGRSYLAPHRLKLGYQCYRRHADRTERMTMREIQDLTLQTERGTQRLERLLADRAEGFKRWVASGRLGIRATVAPIWPLGTEALDEHGPLFRRLGRIMITVGNKTYRLDVPEVVTSRPILRGQVRQSESPLALFGEQEMLMDGTGEVRVSIPISPNERLSDYYVLGAVANALLMADAFRSGTGVPDAEYALAWELAKATGGNWPLKFGIAAVTRHGVLGQTGEAPPQVFPLLQVRGRSSFGGICRIVLNDLRNSAGLNSIKEEVQLEAQQ